MPACCARSASTAPRPISTPTCRRTTTSISRTTTNWSTFPTRIWCCRRCRKCPKATRSPGSTWSCGCARSGEPHQDSSYAGLTRVSINLHHMLFRSRWVAGSSPATTRELLHLLIRVDAPQPLLSDPAAEAVAGDGPPAGGALPDLGHYAGLQAGGDCAGGIGAIVQRRQFILGLHRDDRGAAARQQRVIDPALGAFGVADPTPVLEFGGDFDRQPRAGVDPGDVVVLGRAGAHVHMIRFEADVARHRQAAGGLRRILCRK